MLELSALDFIILVVVALKVMSALVFLWWLDTSTQKAATTDSDDRLQEEATR